MQSTHEFVVQNLQKTKGEWPEVARLSGVPYRTLKKIGSGKTPYPRIDTVEALERYFRSRKAS